MSESGLVWSEMETNANRGCRSLRCYLADRRLSSVLLVLVLYSGRHNVMATHEDEERQDRRRQVAGEQEPVAIALHEMSLYVSKYSNNWLFSPSLPQFPTI